MALPLDMNDSGTRGRYDPIPIEITRHDSRASPQSIGSPRMNLEDENGIQDPVFGQKTLPPRTLFERYEDAVDDLRECYGRNCGRMPTFAMILLFLALLGVMMIFGVIIFLVASASSPSPFTMQGHNTSVPLTNFKWLDDTEASKLRTLGKELFPKLKEMTSCPGFGFACSDRPDEVIPRSQRCNGIPECADSSDERNCPVCNSLFECPQQQSILRGKQPSKICLSSDKICDGAPHCPDGWDEKEFCKERCDEDQYACAPSPFMPTKLQKCLPLEAVCDGVKDCSLGDDEKDCKEVECKRGAMKCKSDGNCIAKEKLCDGNRDCQDGSDETGCTCMTCSGTGRALCGNTCIKSDKVCDGRWHCPDGEDEKDCP